MAAGLHAGMTGMTGMSVSLQPDRRSAGFTETFLSVISVPSERPSFHKHKKKKCCCFILPLLTPPHPSLFPLLSGLFFSFVAPRRGRMERRGRRGRMGRMERMRRLVCMKKKLNRESFKETV